MQLPERAEEGLRLRPWSGPLAEERTPTGFVLIAPPLSSLMPHWLVKTEPSTYSWSQLLAEKRACWDGVRNAQARNNLVAMKVGDQVLLYHSGDDRCVMGIAKVERAAYQDPTTDDARWMCVDLVPMRELSAPVTLATIKGQTDLIEIALVRQSRLSVMPLPADAFRSIVALGKK